MSAEQPREVRVGEGHIGGVHRPGLLMVDCQRLFTLGGTPGSRTEAAVLAAGEAAQRARALGIPVLWLRTIYRDPSELGPVWSVKAPALAQLFPGSELAEFDSRARYAEGEPVVTKRRASGFVRTDLHEQLRALDVHSLAVAGFTTAGCVRATVVDAASLDYLPTVFADGVADRAQQLHDTALVDLDARYADVVESTDWFPRTTSL